MIGSGSRGVLCEKWKLGAWTGAHHEDRHAGLARQPCPEGQLLLCRGSQVPRRTSQVGWRSRDKKGDGHRGCARAGRKGGFLRTKAAISQQVCLRRQLLPPESAWAGKVLDFPLSLSAASPSVPLLSERGGIPGNMDAFCRVRLPCVQSWRLCPRPWPLGFCSLEPRQLSPCSCRPPRCTLSHHPAWRAHCPKGSSSSYTFHPLVASHLPGCEGHPWRPSAQLCQRFLI